MKPPVQTHPDPAPADQIAAALAKLNLLFRQHAWSAKPDTHGQQLAPLQSQILDEVAAATEPITLAELAANLAITPGTASATVTALATKGLVQKTRAEHDARALAITTTPAGTRTAESNDITPNAIRASAKSMPEPERAALMRGLTGLIHNLQSTGAIPTQRMCVNCTFFRPNEHPGEARPHRCDFLNAPIADSNLRINCPDMSTADPQIAERLYPLLIEGKRRAM